MGQRSYCEAHWYLSKVNVISTSIMSELHMPIIKKGQNITTWDSSYSKKIHILPSKEKQKTRIGDLNFEIEFGTTQVPNFFTPH